MSIDYSSLFLEEHQKSLSILLNSKDINTLENQCYLALIYGLIGEKQKMQDVLQKVDESRLSTDEMVLVYHEALIVNAYLDGQNTLARQLAENEILTNKNALWAEYVLGAINEKENFYNRAIQNYKNILAVYPTHHGSLLNLSRAIVISNGDPLDAKKLINEARSSPRKTIYQILILTCGMDWPKLVTILLLLVLFLIPILGTIVLILTVLLILSFLIISLRKVKGDFFVLYCSLVNLGTIALIWFCRIVMLFIF